MLIKEALYVLQGTNERIQQLGVEIVDPDIIGSPRQPRIQRLLNELSMRYTMLLQHIILNDEGTSILGTIGENDEDLNAILTDLMELADINDLPGLPIPRMEYLLNATGGFPLGGSRGDLLVHDGNQWILLSKGNEGEALVSTLDFVEWSPLVGNGIPGGGLTGQVLTKASNTSFDVIWASTISSLQDNGVAVTQRPTINFIEGSNITITIADDSINNRTNVTIAGPSALVESVNAGDGILVDNTDPANPIVSIDDDYFGTAAFEDIGAFDPAGSAAAAQAAAEAYADALISDEAYNATTWNGVTDIGASKNALRDEFENRQPLDAELTAIAGLTSAADKLILFTGSGTATLLDFSIDDTFSGDSDTTIPSEKAIKAYVDTAVIAGTGHEIQYDGTPLATRAGLNFYNGLTARDNAGDDSSDAVLGGPLTEDTEISGAFNLDLTMDELRVENNTAFFTTSPNFEEGVGILFIGRATTPPTTPPTDGVFLWVQQINGEDEIRVMDTSGEIRGIS